MKSPAEVVKPYLLQSSTLKNNKERRLFSSDSDGIKKVFFKGAVLYHAASKDKVMVDAYGVGTPADWIEHNLYSAHSRLGIGILLVFNIIVFGWIGAIIWGIQMLWIPFWAAGVVNGIGHWWGYRNGETKDHSRNIVPWGIVIGGEELHNNHHLVRLYAPVRH